MKRLMGLAGLLALGTACSPFGYGEEAFYEKLGKVSCEKAFECDVEYASETWFNQGNCQDAFQVQADASIQAHAACKYSRRKAKKYIKQYEDLGCTVSPSQVASLDAAWNEVYECDGAAPGGTGETGDTGGTPGAITF